MKLRIGGNSIRLRLLRSEVALLRAGKPLREQLDFGDTTLAYTLATGDAASVTAGFQEGTVAVKLPVSQLEQWADTERVGIYEQIALRGGGTLAIAVEKDFACLDRSDAENKDTFTHPGAGTAC